MINTIYQIIRTARPRQWLKNLSLFAPAIFSGKVFSTSVQVDLLSAFIIFSLLASGIYFLNDIIDAPKDRLHPIKKNRPIAAGKLSVNLASYISFILIAGSLFYSFIYIGSFFTYVIFAYFLIQVSYSLYFRNVIILDSLIVASGFVLRVFAGALASSTSFSSWLALTTIGIALLLAFGKRRSEKTIVAPLMEDSETATTRKTLRHYPDNLLDSMISMSATYAIISYSLFTFQNSPQGGKNVINQFLPSILSSPKWMMLTIPIAIYGVARYLYVIYEKHEGESPERVLLSDMPLLASVILWTCSILFIIYVIPTLE